MSTRMIKFVGKAPRKRDNVTFSNLVWEEQGAVLPVPEAIAVRLLKHPDVWADVTGDGDVPDATVGAANGLFSHQEQKEIYDAIMLLDRGDPKHFDANGKPKLRAIRGILGRRVDEKQRDAAWDWIQGEEMKANEPAGDDEVEDGEG